MEKKQRLDWLDVSKALGVYLVILGHLVIFNYHTFRFIFAFHMPFFFIAAGFVFRFEPSFKKFIKKCSKYYLLPYIAVLILGFIQCLILPMAGHTMQAFLTWGSIKKAFYDGHPCYSFFGSAWFLLAMFWAQLIFYGMQKLGTKLKKYIMVLLWIVLVLTAVFVKDIFYGIPYFERLPFKLDSAMMATVFLGIGHLLKKSGILEKGKLYFSVIFVVGGFFLTWLFGCKWNYYVNLCDCAYGREYNYFIASVAGTIMLFGLGQLLQKCKLLKFIGRNTLFIFLAHEAIYLFILHCVNTFFDKEFYSQSLPLNGWSIGISLLTLAFATILVWGYQHIKIWLRSQKSVLHKDN